MAELRLLMNTASLIILHSSEPRLLCVRHPAFRSWMFPGGKIEPNEAPHIAALREVEEEVGISVTLADLSDLPTWALNGNVRLPQPLAIVQEQLPRNNRVYIDFVFVGIAQSTKLILTGEVQEAGWFDPMALEQLETSFPIKELAASVFERSDEIRSRPRG